MSKATNLSRRERQIMDIVYELKEVSDVENKMFRFLFSLRQNC